MDQFGRLAVPKGHEAQDPRSGVIDPSPSGTTAPQGERTLPRPLSTGELRERHMSADRPQAFQPTADGGIGGIAAALARLMDADGA